MCDRDGDEGRSGTGGSRLGAEAFLGALRLADSALPIGRYVHSGGFESLLAGWPGACDDEIAAAVAAYLIDSAGPLDGVAVASAHGAATVSQLRGLDRMVTARKLTPGARSASTSCGRQLAALAPLFTAAEPVGSYAAAVKRGEHDGNLPVVHGALCAALGLSAQEAVLIELRGAVSSLLSAAVRLGRLSALRSQIFQRELVPVIAEAAAAALACRPEDMRSTAPELDIAVLAHARLEARQFMT
jgi:urease accessory protein